MEVASKVRLVRCPKCGNILPEQPDFSVFQCGGCLSVLQANSKEIAGGEFCEVADEGGRRGVDVKGVININSESVIRNDVREEEGSQSEKSISNEHSSVRIEDRGKRAYTGKTRQGGGMDDPRFSQGRRLAFNDNKDYRVNFRNSINDPAQQNQGDVDLNEVGHKFANSSLEDEIEGISPPARSSRTMSAINDWSMARNGSVSSWRNGANFVQQGRFAKPPYSDEGPSNYEMSSYPGYGDQMRYPEGKDGLDRVAHLENDRAELLKKLDELKEQISKSGEMAQRQGERISSGRRPPTPLDPYARHGAYMPENSQYHFEKQDLRSDEYFPVPSNLTRGQDYAPSIQRPVLSSTDSYPWNHFRNSVAGYGDAYHPQLSRRPLRQPSHQYSQRAYMNRFPDDSMAFNQELFMSHPYETNTHRIAYSSSQSMNKNWNGLAEIPAPIPSLLRSRNDPTNVAPYLRSSSSAMGPEGYLSDGSHFHDQHQFTRPSRLMNNKTDSFHHQRPRQVIVSRGARVYRPICGGAPFIMCLHCFQLLKIPVKLLLGTNQGKLKCGACSSIFVLAYGTKGIVLSVSGEDNHALEKRSYFSNDIPNDKLQTAHDWSKNKIPFSGGHERSDSVSSSSEFEKRRPRHISRSNLSENEERPAIVIVRKDVSYPAKLPIEDDALPRLEDSPHKGSPDQLQTDDSVNLYGEVNEAESMANENPIVEHIIRQGSMKDSPIASEMDISVNDYINSGITRGSTEVSKEGGKSKINKFAGIVKRSLKEFSRSGHATENVKSSILINGHMIPDRLLKKAEKVAGPIQDGDYWYDYRAGFWGVMGHPCAGVIPPKIEEFNFPMPEDCSNGNTKVFVNGRELHQKELNLLSSRGLSITRHKYYFIEISGKVVDEQTGAELESLGKLAPTVESVGHGFGMKIPKSILKERDQLGAL